MGIHNRHKKIFVLDTNVILHDSACIYKFEENDIVVPIAVLEELDRFKKGNESINFHAREFTRALDSLSGNKLFEDGIRIAEGLGKITIKMDQPIHPSLSHFVPSSLADHRILNTAYQLAITSNKKVVLVTKDVNLRMKAKAIGIYADDYTSDHVKDISALYHGHRIIENAPSKLIDNMYKTPFACDASILEVENSLLPNEYMILKNEKKSALAIFDAETNLIKRVDKLSAYGIVPRNAEQCFALHALMNNSIQLVSLTGKAGTGKTLLALAAALECKKNYHQIHLARPIVPLSNKDIGFLPGDIQSKLAPYMLPLYDNLGVIQNQFSENDKRYKKIKEMLDEEQLIISPLSYIRGRSLVNIYFIVDESQNLTPHEVKTIITRAGAGTKIVFTGDVFQIDHPYLNTHSNGLSYLIEKMTGQHIYAHINLKRGERSKLAELASDLL